MTARNTPRGRARSRKRRARAQASRQGDSSGAGARATAAPGDGPAALGDGPAATGESAAAPAAPSRNTVPRARKAPAHSESSLYSPRGVGERPRAPWHPVSASELLILVGAIGAAIGYGAAQNPALTFVGLGAVVIGTVEFTVREHTSGYRSHTIVLAVLAVAVFHSGVVLAVAAFTHVPRSLNVALIALDIALFAVLFKLLRARFLDARRERVFAGGR